MGVVAILNNTNAVPVYGGELGLAKVGIDCACLHGTATVDVNGNCHCVGGGPLSSGEPTPTMQTTKVVPIVTPVVVPAEDDDLLFGVIKTSTALIVAGVGAALYFFSQSGTATTRTVKAGPANGGLLA